MYLNYAQIAEAAGCSKSMVGRVFKDNNLSTMQLRRLNESAKTKENPVSGREDKVEKVLAIYDAAKENSLNPKFTEIAEAAGISLHYAESILTKNKRPSLWR